MRKISIIIALVLLTSCGYDTIDFTKNVIVTDIESDNNNDATGCYYYAKPVKYTRFTNKGYFYDACGKYTVGDTVQIVKR